MHDNVHLISHWKALISLIFAFTSKVPSSGWLVLGLLTICQPSFSSLFVQICFPSTTLSCERRSGQIKKLVLEISRGGRTHGTGCNGENAVSTWHEPLGGTWSCKLQVDFMALYNLARPSTTYSYTRWHCESCAHWQLSTNYSLWKKAIADVKQIRSPRTKFRIRRTTFFLSKVPLRWRVDG